MKWIILVAAGSLIVLNHLAALLLGAYGMPNVALATASLVLSAGMLLHIHSGCYADAYRVALTGMAGFTGLARLMLCVLLPSGTLQGVLILVIIALCMVEVVSLPLVRYASKQR